MPGPHIALINDDTAFLELMRDLLEADEGYQVSICNERDGTYEFVKRMKPDLVIQEHHHRRRRKGWTIPNLLTLHPATRPIPVIVCSAAIQSLHQHQPMLERCSSPRAANPPLRYPEPRRHARRRGGADAFDTLHRAGWLRSADPAGRDGRGRAARACGRGLERRRARHDRRGANWPEPDHARPPAGPGARIDRAALRCQLHRDRARGAERLRALPARGAPRACRGTVSVARED